MRTKDKKMQRLVYFVDELRKQNHPNAESFVKLLKKMDTEETGLACSAKTIKRDVEDLKRYFDAPIDYDRREKGYYLWDPNWSLPDNYLSKDEAFAELFIRKITV